MIEPTRVWRDEDGNVVISLPSRKGKRMIEYQLDPQNGAMLHAHLSEAIGHDCLEEVRVAYLADKEGTDHGKK